MDADFNISILEIFSKNIFRKVVGENDEDRKRKGVKNAVVFFSHLVFASRRPLK